MLLQRNKKLASEPEPVEEEVSQEDNFTCKECNEVSYFPQLHALHMSVHHSPLPKTCPHCLVEYLGPQLLGHCISLHMQAEVERLTELHKWSKKCPVCSKVLYNEVIMAKHMLQQHQKQAFIKLKMDKDRKKILERKNRLASSDKGKGKYESGDVGMAQVD